MSSAVVKCSGPMEVYSVHDRGEWATVCFREDKREGRPHTPGGPPSINYQAELLINSTFGAYSYYWSCMADPFRQFLVSCDRSYLLGKLCSERLEVFDFDKTIEAAKAEIIKARRHSGLFHHGPGSDFIDARLSKLDARLAYTDVEHIDRSDSAELTLTRIGEIDCFKGSEWWHLSKTRERPAAGGLWEHVLEPLREQFRAELAELAKAA